MLAFKKCGLFVAFLLLTFVCLAQDPVVEGRVLDAESGEPLIAATIFASNSNAGTYSNDFGYFKLRRTQQQEMVIRVSYVGYESKELKWNDIDNGDVLIVNLEPLKLDEFVVQSERLIKTKSGTEITINHPSELFLPTLKPEIDIINVIQQQPGVQRTLEGSTGYSVRGGNPDQNLVVMDGIPVYNSGHFGGFVSIFDPFTISKMTFYKGGFPAKFGGRASSVLDVHLKQGNLNSFHGEFKFGPLFSKLSIEGPIQKDRSSFLLSFRRSNMDLLLNGAYLFSKPEQRYGLKFHDLTLKVSHRFDDRNTIYFSFYQGRDDIWERNDRTYFSGEQLSEFSFRRDNSWGNLFANLRLGSELGSTLHLNTSVAISSFDYDYARQDHTIRDGNTFTKNTNTNRVHVKDYLIKTELEYLIGKRTQLDFGGQMIFHDFMPVDAYGYRFEEFGLSETNSETEVRHNAVEAFGYVQASIQNSKGTVRFKPGLRFGMYSIESTNFYSLQPRLLFTYQLKEDLGIQVDYSKSFQPVHSLNSSGTSLTPDIWIPATRRLAPVESHTTSLSITQNKENWTFSGGTYYRDFSNLVEMDRNNGFAVAKEDWESAILGAGKGTAYGFEISGDRRYRKIKISGNYTFSRSFREFDAINNGESFPFNFDRPHSFNLAANLRITEKSSLSFFGEIQSGQPFTVSSQSHFAITNAIFSKDLQTSNSNWGLDSANPVFFQETLLPQNVNGFRMPVYHRIDLAFANRKRWKNGILREWNFSIYNVLNRKNAYFIYLNTNNGNFEQFTLMPFLPSFSYNLKF